VEARSAVSHSLLQRLASGDAAERRAACQAAAADDSAALLADGLADALGDPAPEVARAAARALAAIAQRPGGRDAVAPALRRALHSRVKTRRWRAAIASLQIAPPTPRLLPPLVEALGSSDSGLRWAAARALAQCGRLHAEVQPLLAGLVQSAELPATRRMAIFALRKLAPERAGEALAYALGDADAGVRRAAALALAGRDGQPGADSAALSSARAMESIE